MLILFAQVQTVNLSDNLVNKIQFSIHCIEQNQFQKSIQ